MKEYILQQRLKKVWKSAVRVALEQKERNIKL